MQTWQGGRESDAVAACRSIPAVAGISKGWGERWATVPAAAESDIILFFNVPAWYSMVFHNEIHAACPAQILLGVSLVIVVSPAFIHPSIDVGERYKAIVRLVNLEFSVAEDTGRRLPQRALNFAMRFQSGM
jgi:hypothetical protein